MARDIHTCLCGTLWISLRLPSGRIPVSATERQRLCGAAGGLESLGVVSAGAFSYPSPIMDQQKFTDNG
jgi:hypothetical protein